MVTEELQRLESLRLESVRDDRFSGPALEFLEQCELSSVFVDASAEIERLRSTLRTAQRLLTQAAVDFNNPKDAADWHAVQAEKTL